MLVGVQLGHAQGRLLGAGEELSAGDVEVRNDVHIVVEALNIVRLYVGRWPVTGTVWYVAAAVPKCAVKGAMLVLALTVLFSIICTVPVPGSRG